MITTLAIILIIIGVGILVRQVFIGKTMQSDQITKELIHYPDFDIALLEIRELTSEQEASKKASIDNGVDGGISMLQSSIHYKVLSKDGKILLDSEVEMLPYARDTFSVDGKDFTFFGNMKIEDSEGKEYKSIK